MGVLMQERCKRPARHVARRRGHIGGRASVPLSPEAPVARHSFHLRSCGRRRGVPRWPPPVRCGAGWSPWSLHAAPGAAAAQGLPHAKTARRAGLPVAARMSSLEDGAGSASGLGDVKTPGHAAAAETGPGVFTAHACCSVAAGLVRPLGPWSLARGVASARALLCRGLAAFLRARNVCRSGAPSTAGQNPLRAGQVRLGASAIASGPPHPALAGASVSFVAKKGCSSRPTSLPSRLARGLSVAAQLARSASTAPSQSEVHLVCCTAIVVTTLARSLFVRLFARLSGRAAWQKKALT